jgi:hypothetical protein
MADSKYKKTTTYQYNKIFKIYYLKKIRNPKEIKNERSYFEE